MNVPQYLLVKGFKQAFSIYTCNLHVPAPCWLHPKKLLDKREEGLVTSHLNNLGDSLTCLLQDCLNMPRLPEYSFLIVSAVNGKVADNVTSIFCHSVICLGTDKCCWGRNHEPGRFMNVPQASLPHIHLQPVSVAVPCWLHLKNS